MTNPKIVQGRAIAQAQAQDQSKSIPYHPQYAKITGTVTAAILLQQMNFWWHISNRRPFYKFRAPCEHEKYREKDSWTEELGIGTTAFDNALKKIAAKVVKGASKTELFKEHLVIYWTDRDRITWYQLNEDLFAYAIYLAYNSPNDLSGKAWVTRYLEELQGDIDLEELQGVTYIPSEITSEITTEKSVLSSPENPTPEPTPATAPVTEQPIGYLDSLAAFFGDDGPKSRRERIRDALAAALNMPVPDTDFLVKRWDKGLDALVGEFRGVYDKRRLDDELMEGIIGAIGLAKSEDGWEMCRGPSEATVSRIVAAGRNGKEEEARHAEMQRQAERSQAQLARAMGAAGRGAL